MNSAGITRLATALAALQDPGQIEAFLVELLTPTECHDLALRLELMELLAAGVSQRQVAAQLGVSLCKITRGAKILKKNKGVIASLVKPRLAQAEAGKAGKAHGTRVTRKSED